MTIDDGYIKYDRSHFTKAAALKEHEFTDIEKWRAILFEKELIGEYQKEKIGYGNISKRADYSHYKKTSQPQFCISATQTGKHPILNGNHYTRVLDFNISENIIVAQGPNEASSESLTHGAIYSSNQEINYVFHIHSKKIWLGMIKDKLPTTSAEIPYGTMQMANAVQDITNQHYEGWFAMEGHEDGVVIYSKQIEKAGELTLELYNRYQVS